MISHTTEVPTSAPTLAMMIGLGVGIDYALFIGTRHRSQLAEGMVPREPVARATATAGGAVVFAGRTVIIALLSRRRWDTAGDDARLHGGDRCGRRGLGCHYAAARDPRSDRALHQLPASAWYAGSP